MPNSIPHSPGQDCTGLLTRGSRGCTPSTRSGGFFPRDLGALFASFRKTDGDRLLPACNSPAFATLAGAERTAFFPTHGAGHAFACGFAIFTAAGIFA